MLGDPKEGLRKFTCLPFLRNIWNEIPVDVESNVDYAQVYTRGEGYMWGYRGGYLSDITVSKFIRTTRMVSEQPIIEGIQLKLVKYLKLGS